MDDLVKDSAVFELVLSVAEEQMARGKPFFDTLSKTLGVQADYNNWIQGKQPTPDIEQKVEECLTIWNDRNHGMGATRMVLVDTLKNNQGPRKSCQALIVKLEGFSTNTSGANSMSQQRTVSSVASVGSSSNSGAKEDWTKLEEVMTPENLSKCGIMEYTSLAQCLSVEVLTKYQMYVGNFPGMTDPMNIKLMNLLRIWKALQTDLQRPVSNFLANLEDGQRKGGTNSLNALIALIKETVPRENNVSRMFGTGHGGQNQASFGNDDEDVQGIRGLKLTAAFKGLTLGSNKNVDDVDGMLDEVDAGFQKKVNIAICIFNTYDNQLAKDDGWGTLPGAMQDVATIRGMLENDYNIAEMTDQDDIEHCVVQMLRQWQDVKIGRLHFHFSGHGIFNQTVQINDSQRDEVDSGTPFGECILGNNGDQGLCSILRIQNLLTQFNADIITLTLDCCRSLDRPQTRQRVKLAKLPVISNDDWLRIATVYSSCKTRPAFDQTSFSNELSRVISSTKGGRIPINKIAKLVNESWRKDGFNHQYCNIERIEGGKLDWDKLYWPL